MSVPSTDERPNPWMATALAILPVAAAALIGNRATLPNLAPWYESLAKPWFNPPNGVFAPVWTALYVLMIVAFRRILMRPAGEPGRRAAITAFLVQIALNAGWSVAFFGFRSPLAGVIVIGWLLVAVAVTIRTFASLDRVAALLLVPYFAWITFATVLTVDVWTLNR